MRHHKIIQSVKSIILILASLPLAAQQHQIVIDSVIGVTRDAIRVAYAESNGIQINSAGSDGIQIDKSGHSGVYVNSASLDGVRVNLTGRYGVSIGNSSSDGIYVNSAGGHGVFVNTAAGHSMNIQGNKSASTLAAHIGLIYNRNTTTNADVLALKVGTFGNPAAGNNFITFYNGADVSLGAVQGNGSSSVCYTTGGCDYAEYLPLMDHADAFSPGDIVGVYGGHISKQTANAQRVMVITDQAAMIGNKPVNPENDGEIEGYETVSFIGQVRTKVRGNVQAGDWIVASGCNDGTALAMATSDIGFNHQIVGRAWESSSDPGIKRINTAVGLDQSQIWTEVIRAQQLRNQNLQNQINALQNQVNRNTWAITENSDELQIYGKLQLTNTDLNE